MVNRIVLEEAIRLAVRTGWPLFPLVGKIPAIGKADGGHGHLDATADPGELERLFARAPHATGFGISCGPAELVVLDLDVKDGLDGRDSAREAGLDYLAAETPRATTPRGGSHVYYRGAALSREAVLLNVDVKGLNGYVVAPFGPGRSWEVEASPWDVEPAPAPDWLLRLSPPRTGRGPTPPEEWARLVRQGVAEGNRDRSLTRIAGHLLRRHLDPEVTLELLLAWNAARCRPPVAEDQVRKVVGSVLRKEMERRNAA